MKWRNIFKNYNLFILSLVLLIVLPNVNAYAEAISLDLGDLGGSDLTSRMFQVIILITILSIAPAILIMATSFTRIVVVLSLLRSALGLQQTPPNIVIVSLSLFLTLFIMSPVFQAAYNDGVQPLINGDMAEEQALENTAKPFHDFMIKRTREKDLSLFMDMANINKIEKPEDTPYRILLPAFMIGELKRAFEIGFLIFIPFLIIDLLVASILMAMGMLMLPPVMISLPFKLIFFVLIDGWYMVTGSLVKGFGI